jgi:hypothetical protein
MDEAPIFSARLEALLAEILAGRAPDAGRFCGRCYDPLSPNQKTCSHCATKTSTHAPVEQIPREVIDMVRARRGRESLVVRSMAYGGLAVALALALIPLLFLPFWWGFVAFFSVVAVGYVVSANVANSLGDAIGYRWGQRTLARRWQEFIERRGY